MRNKYSQSLKNLFSRSYKAQDKKFRSQKEAVYNSIAKNPKTTLMIHYDTGVLRANICRRINELQDEGRVELVKKTICKISDYRAGYYIATSKDK